MTSSVPAYVSPELIDRGSFLATTLGAGSGNSIESSAAAGNNVSTSPEPTANEGSSGTGN